MELKVETGNIGLEPAFLYEKAVPNQVVENSIISSPKAGFRKFLAEASIHPGIHALQAQEVKAINDLSLNQVGKEAEIYHSDRSGELKRTFLKTLAEAKESIVCMTFSFSDQEILDLLLQKAEEGVKVTLVIDKNHMGLAAPYASTFTLLTRKEGEGRIHHKITVLDEAAVWIGSANFSPDALTRQSNTMIYLESKEMAKALHEEMEVFLGTRQRTGISLPPLMIKGQEVELLLFPNVPFGVGNSPERALNEYGKKRILDLINNATSSLRLAVCVWTDTELAEAVINAKNRGVKVEVLLWKEVESMAVAGMLRRAGISVTQKPQLPLMHNKWMVVDNEHFLNCSANWSKSWFSRNDESAILLNNLNQSQKKHLSDYWNVLITS
jgi:phosphatidylserine/phosphatidylglycerophosphate/cardiolipin synthase-like enzyme